MQCIISVSISFSRGFHSCLWCVCCSMADNITSVITSYQDRLKGLTNVPATTYGRAVIGEDGVANKLFLAFLFADKEFAVQFLKDTGLLRLSVVCNVCDTLWTTRSVSSTSALGFTRTRWTVRGARLSLSLIPTIGRGSTSSISFSKCSLHNVAMRMSTSSQSSCTSRRTQTGASLLLPRGIVPRDSLLPRIYYYMRRRSTQVSNSFPHYGWRVTDYVSGLCPYT